MPRKPKTPQPKKRPARAKSAGSAKKGRMRAGTTAATIDAYIAGHPPEIRARLEAMRATIRQHAPGAEERISYAIPTFHLGGNLVHFAAFTRHVGFYPGAAAIANFRKALAGYASAKGSVQFPHTEPLPLDLVAEIVRFRVADQAVRNAARSRRRSRAAG